MRLAIYVHYSPDHHIQDYELVFLRSLGDLFSQILVVSNGELNIQDQHLLSSLDNVQLLLRENQGFDFHAWKFAMEAVGWDNLAGYEEILITNNTCYGPLYPLSEMFDAMGSVSCDFWGITAHPAFNRCFIKNNSATRISKHLQSYWIVFRKSVLTSEHFQEFWESIPPMNSFEDAVGFGELHLTSFFRNRGFSFSSYINYDEHPEVLTGNPCSFSDVLVINERCPVVKRKFFYDYAPHYRENGLCGDHRGRKLLDYIHRQGLFDCNLILDDLLKITEPLQLRKSLHISYVMNSDTPVVLEDCFHSAETREEQSGIPVLVIQVSSPSLEDILRKVIIYFRGAVQIIIQADYLPAGLAENFKQSIISRCKLQGEDSRNIWITGSFNQSQRVMENFRSGLMGYLDLAVLQGEDEYAGALLREWYLTNFAADRFHIKQADAVLQGTSRIGCLMVESPQVSAGDNDMQCFWTTREIFGKLSATTSQEMNTVLRSCRKLASSLYQQNMLISGTDFLVRNNNCRYQRMLTIEKPENLSRIKNCITKIQLNRSLAKIPLFSRKATGKISKYLIRLRKALGLIISEKE